MSDIPFQAVFLDAGNTLFTEIRPRHELYASTAIKFGGSIEADDMRLAMKDAYANLPSLIDGHFRFSIGWFRTFNDRMMQAAGVEEARFPEAHEALVSLFENPNTYHLFPDVIPTLKELANRDIPVCVISNWSERLPLLIKGLGLHDLVQFTVASAEIRVEKPQRAFFERALFRAGATAESTVLIGDRLDRDIRGALQAGMRAILLDRSSPHSTTREHIPVATSLLDALKLKATLDCDIQNHA